MSGRCPMRRRRTPDRHPKRRSAWQAAGADVGHEQVARPRLGARPTARVCRGILRCLATTSVAKSGSANVGQLTCAASTSTVASTLPSGAKHTTAPPPHSVTQSRPSASIVRPSGKPSSAGTVEGRAPVGDGAVRGHGEQVDAPGRGVDVVDVRRVAPGQPVGGRHTGERACGTCRPGRGGTGCAGRRRRRVAMLPAQNPPHGSHLPSFMRVTAPRSGSAIGGDHAGPVERGEPVAARDHPAVGRIPAGHDRAHDVTHRRSCARRASTGPSRATLTSPAGMSTQRSSSVSGS